MNEACRKTDWQVLAYCLLRKEFERHLEARRLEPGDRERLRALRRGWCLDTEGFRQELLERAEGQLGEHHFGALRQESAEAKAERIIGEELGRRGWRETTLTLKEIAERLHLGTPRSASARLHLATKEPTRRALGQGNLAT